MRRVRRASMAALVTLVLVVGCSEDAEVPVRVAAVPAEVRGLGPAVLAVPVADDNRDDRTGLLAVERFGDDLAGLTPGRRHARVAFGDPRFPTVAQGLAKDGRDALLVNGRLRDATLPDDMFIPRATAVGPALTVTRSNCLVVTGAGTVTRPGTNPACTAAVQGGVVWQDRPGGPYGGINVESGELSPTVGLPSYPIAATPDGRYLAAITSEEPRRFVIADTRTGRSSTTVTLPSPTEAVGVFTSDGFAVLHRPGKDRTISLVTPDGRVRDLLAPVGDVAFNPDGRHAVVVDTRSGVSRLAILDLPSGTVRPVLDGSGQGYGPAALPPLTGAVTIRTSGDSALVVDLPGVRNRDMVPRPSRIWSVRLSTATATAHPDPPKASGVRIHEPAGAAAVPALPLVPALVLEPGGEAVTVTPDGTLTVAPRQAAPRAVLGKDAVLHDLSGADGRPRADRLLVIDGTGRRTEVPTGAGPDQRVGQVIPTPDGAHLLISLRAARPGSQPGTHDTVVVARRDGTGKPVVVYQGVILASLGTTDG